MGMTQTAVTRDSSIEYTIYTFQRSKDKNTGPERWQKQDTVSDMNQAVQKAEAFFSSGDYCKVEIKQKYTDPKNNRVIDMTLKTLTHRKKMTFGTGMMVGMAAMCGFAAFAVTYFLGRGG